MPEAIRSNPRPLAAALAALLIFITFAACSRSTTPDAPQIRPNVVIFMIDTLRRDRLGVYGYDKPTSPVIDALAAEGVLFDRAYTSASWTCPSVPSLFTSTWLFEHGVLDGGMQLASHIQTLAERFQRLGYFTSNIYVNNFAGPMNGMDRGFDLCRKPRGGKHWIDGDEFEHWLVEERDPERPFFVYIHNIEPHNPFNAPDRLIPIMGETRPVARSQLGQLINAYRPLLRADFNAGDQQVRPLGTTDNTTEQNRVLDALHAMLAEHNVLYDAVVRHADERVGEVIQKLRKHDLWEDTLFIIVSDHGEELAEHGAYLHSQSLYEELIAAPLVMRFPRNLYAGQRVPEVVRNIDLLPTIFAYLGRPDLNDGARGEVLLPYIEGRVRDEPFVVVGARHNKKKYYKPWATTRGNINIAMLTADGRYKGIWNKEMQVAPGQWDESLESFELYDLLTDPTEQVTVCHEHPELMHAMVDYARRMFAQTAGDAPGAQRVRITDEQMQGLRDLGYVGGHEELEHLDEAIAQAGRSTVVTEPGKIVEPCEIDW